MCTNANVPGACDLDPQPAPPPPRTPSQPIAYGICADFSLGKQQFYEKHEGVKIMSWSTTMSKSQMLLPSAPGTPKASVASPVASRTVSSDATPSAADPPVQRAMSGKVSSDPVGGGWYSGLEVYLFRILTETSMSVGWGRMLKHKRVSRRAVRCLLTHLR